MKKRLLLFLVFSFHISFGQNFKIGNLFAFNSLSLSEIDFYMNKSNFVIDDSKNETNSTSIKYIYKNSESPSIFESFQVSRNSDRSTITYSFYTDTKNEKLINELINSGFKLSNSSKDVNVLRLLYTNDNFHVEISKIFVKEFNENLYIYYISVD